MSRISRPSSGPNTTRSPAATTRSTMPLTRTPTPDNLAGRTWTRPAPPSVVNASRPRATSRTPELTRRSTPRSWSHAPQRRSSAWPTSGPGRPRPRIERRGCAPPSAGGPRCRCRTGTGHVSAGCPGLDRQSRVRAGRRPPVRTRAGRRAGRPPAGARGPAPSCRPGPWARTGRARPGRSVRGRWPTPGTPRPPSSSATAARVRGDSSVPAPGISVGRLHTAVAIPSAAARSARAGNRRGSAASPL